MENQSKVVVVMATYNGEKYIRKQIESIIHQDYENIELWIRDDGSSDGTVSIIKDYCRKDSRIHLIKDDLGNLKPPRSFYAALRQCPEADYYSFADQDDIWLSHKIKNAVEMLDREDSRFPLVYMARHRYVDENGKLIRNFPLQKNIDFYKCLFNSPGSGFTFLINKKATEEFIPDGPEYTEMHDRWLARSAVCFGRLIYDPRICASHVRHKTAVTSNDTSNVTLLRAAIKNELFGNETRKEKQHLRRFYFFYRDSLNSTEKRTLKLFGKRKNSPAIWFKKFFFPHRLMTRLSGEIMVRFLIFTGRI